MHEDIHPEELLVGRRALSEDVRATLRVHFEQCPACALQATLSDDAARALVPTELDYEIAARAVERALSSAPLAAVRPPTASLGRLRVPRATRAAAGLLVLLGTSVAAAAVILGTHGRLWDVETPAPTEPRLARRLSPTPRLLRQPVEGHVDSPLRPQASPARDVALPSLTDPAARDLRPAPHGPVAPSAPMRRWHAKPVSLHTALGERPTPALPPEAIPPSQTAVAAPTGERLAPSESAAAPPTTVGLAPTGIAVAPEVVVSAADRAATIFAAAERARREGRPTEADRLYGVLESDCHGTREERLSRVLRGQMLLENLGRPVEALASFGKYLRDDPMGPLAEEARAGRAQALWYLGRAHEERLAWTELLALYPRSLHATQARNRLTALAKIGQ
jgi:hypothetical protein